MNYADTNWLESLYITPDPNDSEAVSRRGTVERFMRKQAGQLATSHVVLLVRPPARQALPRGSLQTALRLAFALVILGGINSMQAQSIWFLRASEIVYRGQTVYLPLITSRPLATSASLQVQIIGGTAAEGVDFTLSPKTINIMPGLTNFGITLTALPGSVNANPKTLQLALANPTGGLALGTPSEVAIILASQGIHFSAGQDYMAGENVGNYEIRVIRDAPYDDAVLVDYYTEPLTATPGVDYEAVNGQLQFTPGDSTKVINVPIINNHVMDSAEREFRVVLTNATAAGRLTSPSQIDVKILDNELGYVLNALFVEATTGFLRIPVYRQGDFDLASWIDYAVTGLTATAGEDFIPTSGTLFFEAGQGVQYIFVRLLNDLSLGVDETFQVTLSNPSSDVPIHGSPTAAFTILHQQPVELGFVKDSVNANETDAGATLSVRLNCECSVPVTVLYATTNVTAEAGQDYLSTNGVLTFAPGQVSQTLSVRLINDTWWKGQRQFQVLLTDATTNVLIQPAEATVIIEDNDLGFALVAHEDNTVFGENAGPAMADVIILGDPPTTAVNVHFAVQSDSAKPGQDYTAVSGTLTFGPGETRQSIAIPLLDNDRVDGERGFYVVLDQPSDSMRIQTPTLWLTIRDDEINLAGVDPDFNPGFPFRHGTPVAVEPDGKILLQLTRIYLDGEDGSSIIRLFTNGLPDPTWQIPRLNFWPSAFALQSSPNNSSNACLVLAVGPSADATVNGTSVMTLARLNPDGTLDAGFAPQAPYDSIWPTVLAVQNDGKILAAFKSENYFFTFYSLYRIQREGALDTTFTGPRFNGNLAKIMVSTNGAIWVQGDFTEIEGQPRAGFARLEPSGSLDPNFLLDETLSILRLIDVQSDGRPVLFHSTTNGLRLSRFEPDGQIDPTFAAPHFSDSGNSFVPATDHSIWWFHQNADGGGLEYGVFRLNTDGSQDATWPPARLVFAFNQTGQTSGIHSLPLPDGHPLVFGDFSSINGHPQRLARLASRIPRIEVDPSSAVVPENGGKTLIQLVRCGSHDQPLTVNWSTTGGSAKPGLDYLAASGTLRFAANQSLATIELTILNNTLADADRTVRLRMEGVSPETIEYPLVQFTIANDDPGFLPAGFVHFDNGRVLLRLTGLGRLRLEKSSELMMWQVFPPTDSTDIVDYDAPGYLRCFYRVSQTGN